MATQPHATDPLTPVRTTGKQVTARLLSLPPTTPPCSPADRHGGVEGRNTLANSPAHGYVWGMSAARIGKIRLKSGGAEVRLLRQQTREDGENYRGLIIEHARMVAEYTPQAEMVGFVLIGLFSDGSYSSSTRLDASAALGRTMLPSYIAEVVRRDVLMEPIADGVI